MKLTDKVLGYLASSAEDAFWEALGLASRNGSYEPEMSEEVKAIKASNVSKVEMLYKKLSK